jgi:hypothetical protein
MVRDDTVSTRRDQRAIAAAAGGGDAHRVVCAGSRRSGCGAAAALGSCNTTCPWRPKPVPGTVVP